MPLRLRGKYEIDLTLSGRGVAEQPRLRISVHRLIQPVELVIWEGVRERQSCDRCGGLSPIRPDVDDGVSPQKFGKRRKRRIAAVVYIRRRCQICLGAFL